MAFYDSAELSRVYMSSLQSDARFYVVGGPVQPDRDCYVLRDADAALYTYLCNGDYCHVFAPADTGKTSLIAQTSARLLDDGYAVANIDLAQISNRDVTDDIGRWYYSVVYRVVRELRIRFDLQEWWKERSGLTNLQRLREFFSEVVLADDSEKIVIFIDRIETALEHIASRDLFGAIRACYDARASDPEFRRLTFALLGSAPPGKPISSGQESPFDISMAIALPDFDLDELGRLTAGLHCDGGVARAIARRVWHWTSGHPYLTQKILRSLSRRPVAQMTDDDVDQWVTNLFLTRNATREEPHISLIRSHLLRESRDKVARLSLYGKVSKGALVDAEHALPTHRDLLRSGLLVEDSDGKFAIRNRVYGEVFTPHWVNRNLPFSVRGLLAVATVLSLAISIPIWYSEYLPRPYIRALSSPDAEFLEAQNAYERLHFLPGFGSTAEQLFGDYLAAQSREATRLSEAQRFAELLAELPGQADRAAALQTDFWDRKKSNALARGDRDAALLFALQAPLDATPDHERNLYELLGGDYQQLLSTIRSPESLEAFALDGNSGLLSLLNSSAGLGLMRLDEDGLQRARNLELLAEELIPQPTTLFIKAAGNGRRMKISVETDHVRPRDIQLELRSPSGRQARTMLTDAGATADGYYRLDSRQIPALRELLEESVGGTWTAYFTDLVQGIGGSLKSWSLEIDGQVATAEPSSQQGLLQIPEPKATRQATNILGPAGRFALSWPSSPEVRGDVLVWDIARAEVTARIPRPPEFTNAGFALGQRAVLLTIGRSLQVWDVQSASLQLTIPIESAFAPVLSENGRFLVVDAVDADANNSLLVWDLEAGRKIGQLSTGSLASLASIDDAGRLLAVSDGERLLRLWDVATGQVVAELVHGSAPTAIHFHPQGRWLATEDATHTFRLWVLDDLSTPVLTRHGASSWAVDFDSHYLLFGSLAGGYELVGLDDLAGRGVLLRHGTVNPAVSLGSSAGQVQLSTAMGIAVSWDGERALRLWRLPQLEEGPTRDATTLATGGIALGAIDPAGRQVAVASASGDLRILAASSDTLLIADRPAGPGFVGHPGPISALDFSASGALVASGGIDGSLRVWESATGAPRRFFASQGDGAILDLQFSPDEINLISASQNSVLVTSAKTGAAVARTAIKSRRPQLLISKDGNEIYIAGNRQGLSRWIWRANLLEPFLEAADNVQSMALSPDNRLIATVDASYQARLWSQDQMSLPSSVRLPALPDRLWFSVDGQDLYSQSGYWLYRLQVMPDGLVVADVRLLTERPLDIRGQQNRDLLALNDTAGSRLDLVPLDAAINEASAYDIPREELLLRLPSQLGLRLSEWGEPDPVQPF